MFNYFIIYKNNNKIGFLYYDLKVEGFYCVLGKNENICVIRLIENRNFIFVYV